MNQREEERVVEALRALTGGLTVTDQDIIEAGGRFRSALNPPPRRRRAALLVAAAAAAVLAGVVAVQAIDRDEGSAPPAAPAEPTAAETLQDALQADPYLLDEAEFNNGTRVTPRSLAGLWMLRPVDESPPDEFVTAPLYVDGDGGWRIGVPTAPLSWGESTLTADTWARNLDRRSQCAKNNNLVGAVQSPTAALAADGSLRVRLSNAGLCTILNEREVWDRLTPGSPVMDYLQTVSEDIAWEANMDEAPQGVYVAPGTGHMLIVEADRSYRYYDNLTAARLVAVDQGELDTDPLDAVAGTCGGGIITGGIEAGSVPGVPGYVHPLSAMRITADGNGCGSGVAEQGVWVQLFGSPTESPYQD